MPEKERSIQSGWTWTGESKRGGTNMAFSCVLNLKEECDGCATCEWMGNEIGTQEGER